MSIGGIGDVAISLHRSDLILCVKGGLRELELRYN